MEVLNPIEINESIQQKYLSFILTTVCRDNKDLRKELKDVFEKDQILWRDLILQGNPKYKSEPGSLNSLDFNIFIKEYILNHIPNPYSHQIKAWKNILEGRDCIIATGTGSGKTEGFVIPIVNHCAKKDIKRVQAIIVYPLKALSQDQGNRIGKILDEINNKHHTNIRYAILDGDTEKREPSGNSSELCSKLEIMNSPPNILLTNYVMLERILLDPRHSSVLKEQDVKYIVLDEIHYYRGAQGIDVSLLMRRLQFHLSLNQNISNIQYIGTSATLGAPDSKEIEDFLYKLFNKEISVENIIKPEFSEDFIKDPFHKPKFLSQIKDTINPVELGQKSIRTHSFFCSPPSFYRCFSCNKIYYKETNFCSECKSKLIFEILTCRQCGKEYFNYPFSVNSKDKSDITFDDLDINGPLYPFDKDSNYEKKGEIVLSKDSIEGADKKVLICSKCSSLYHDSELECSQCKSLDFIEVYGVEKKDTPINLNDKSNNRYCPFCDFTESRQSLIVPISKLSDENCSHIVFDEYFMALPDERRKLLVFTDNVQRASKFAREIEETHLKKMVRTELHKIIENLDSPVDISDIIHFVIKEIKKKITVSEYLELNLKKEIYDELFSSGKKVGSLANRNIFDLSISKLDQFTEEQQIGVIKAFEVFRKKRQLLGYYHILKNEEMFSINEFLEENELLEKIHREINNLKRKRLNSNDFSDAKNIINLLVKAELLNNEDNKYFLKEESIEVIRLDNISNDEENYYDQWKELTIVPALKSRVDTGKTRADERSNIERDFKESNKLVNFLVATPTLELGIDIGDLDIVGLLYSPPSPAQYVQRTGRAGRLGQSSFAITYLSKRSLDSMYFYNPEELVEGEIKPPSFVLDLTVPIKKALFSLFFYYTLHFTNFRKEPEGIAWNRIDTWENKFPQIRSYWKKYESDFFEFLKKYSQISGIDINYENLIDEWSLKLKEFIEIQRNLKSGESNYNKDIFNYFQQAGLLPDYAFGTAESIVNVYGGDPIVGYSLREVCPPSTLDHDKSRFKCTHIDLSRSVNIKKVASKYKICPKCQGIMSLKDETDLCPICNVLLEVDNTSIIEPRIIKGRRSTFSLKQKRVLWDYYVIDLPYDIKYNNYVSDPIMCSAGMIFSSVYDNENLEDYYLCEKCGELYSKNSKKSDRCIHVRSKQRIGKKFNTRAVVIDLSKFDNCNYITFLNALISAVTVEAGCEEGEVSGLILRNSSKIGLFDDIEGGVGFVDVLSNRFKDTIKRAKSLCENDCCENGCVRCIGSYWRQNDLDYLKKREIIPIFDKMLN